MNPFLRVVTRAGFISLALGATAHAQNYRVVTTPWQDSILTQGIDSATTEKAFCASAVISTDSLTITVDQVIEAPFQQAFAANENDSDGVTFACPRGAVLIHWHLGPNAHHGPSAPDLRILLSLPTRPPAAFIVYRGPRGVEYIAYEVAP